MIMRNKKSRKNIRVLLLLVIILFPFVVNAEVCQKDDIKINSIETVETRGNIEEISNPTPDNNQVNLGIKMNVIDDSITYKVVLKNTSSSDYVFDKNQIEKDYINYEIIYDDESNTIKAGEEKIIYLKLSYSNKPQIDQLSNGVLTDTKQVSFKLINNEDDSLINPETGNRIFYILVISLIIVSIILIKNKKNVRLSIIVIAILLIPQLVKASCTCTLNINLNLEIDAKEAVFLQGTEVNVKMKHLAGDDTSGLTNEYTFQNQTINSILKSDIEPSEMNKEEKNIVSIGNSEYPIYMWYENGTIYWWSEDQTPSLNGIGSRMFAYMTNLSNIEGVSSFDSSDVFYLNSMFHTNNLDNVDDLSSWNLSNAIIISYMFFGNTNLTSIEGLSQWETSKVNNMISLFEECTNLGNFIPLKNWNTSNVTNMNNVFKKTKITDLKVLKDWNTSNVQEMRGTFDTDIIESTKGLENWDVSNVTTMENLFARNYYLTDLSGLKDWDTSKVKDFGQTFLSCIILEDLSPLKDWDLSNATDIYSMFNNNQKLQDLTPLSNWKVSNVKRLFRTFRDCSTLKGLTGLENWDVSKVEDFSQLFYKNTELSDISALTNWDTSSGTNMSSMFYGDKVITNVSAINDWNIENVTTFSHMFRYSPTKPTFTKRTGTWDSQGTFTPD